MANHDIYTECIMILRYCEHHLCSILSSYVSCSSTARARVHEIDVSPISGRKEGSTVLPGYFVVSGRDMKFSRPFIRILKNAASISDCVEKTLSLGSQYEALKIHESESWSNVSFLFSFGLGEVCFNLRVMGFSEIRGFRRSLLGKWTSFRRPGSRSLDCVSPGFSQISFFLI